jgi:hypothetical protein
VRTDPARARSAPAGASLIATALPEQAQGQRLEALRKQIRCYLNYGRNRFGK